MKCKEGKEVELIAELTDQQYDKLLYISNARATAEQTLQNKSIIDLIQDDKMLKKFYTSLYLQIAAAQYEYTLFIRDIANMYNLDITNMCICDKKVYTITHNNICTKE